MTKRYYQQAPFNYDCPYQHCCPHLEGLSTQWVFEEYQCSDDEHFEHWKLRDDQQEQLEKSLAYIDELRAKLEALHRRQFNTDFRMRQKFLPKL